MRTRIISLLLCVVMLIGMLPMVALAEEPQTADITAGDNGAAALTALGGVEKAEWNGETKPSPSRA